MEKEVLDFLKKMDIPKEEHFKFAQRAIKATILDSEKLNDETLPDDADLYTDTILFASMDKYVNNNNTYVALYTSDGEVYCDLSQNYGMLPCDKINISSDLDNENGKILINAMVEQGLIKQSSDGSYFLLRDFFPMENILTLQFFYF